MSKLGGLSIALITIIISGCSGVSGINDISQKVPEPTELLLLPPNEGPAPVLLTQRVTLHKWGQKRQFLVLSKMTDENMSLVALLPTGHKLMSLDYDGKTLQQQSLPGMDLPVQDIMAIIQFSIWPEISVAKHYRVADGWVAELDASQRKLRTGSEQWLDVRYTANEMQVKHLLNNYQVHIKTLEQKDL